MIQKTKTILLGLFLTSILAGMIALAACTKIDEGNFLKPLGLPEWKGQYILLEEYTGQRCPNCPKGAQVAADMSNLFGDKLIVVGMHVTQGFAAPAAGYPNDYRTEAGTIYDETFVFGANAGLPQGMVSRSLLDSKRVLEPGEWSARALKLYQEEAVAKMSATATMGANKQINISVNATFEKEYIGVGDVHLITWIVEDSIISRQASGSSTIANYVHRHVMRGAVNGAWGQKVAPAQVEAAFRLNSELQIACNEAWKPQHLYVVSLLFDMGNDKDKGSVIQVIETHVKITE